MAYRLDISYPSRVFYPAFLDRHGRAISTLVSAAPNIQTIRENLRRIMARKGVKPTTLSQRIGPSKTLVKDLLEKNDDVRFGTLTKLAGALDVDIDQLLARPRVPVVGKIGAGGSVIFLDVGENVEPDETVARPPGVSGKLVALVVDGASMLPKYKDGDVIYIQRQHDGVLDEYLGDDCAVRLVSGETYIKQLVRGSAPDLFTLRSLNAPDMEDVRVEWATPVLFIMPARARKMLDE